jgi:hypothetical protein
MNHHTVAPLIPISLLLALGGCGSGGTVATNQARDGAEPVLPASDGSTTAAGERLACGLISGPGEDLLSALAATPDGGLIAAGTFEGRADLDPGADEEMRGQEDGRAAYVISLDAEGGVRWARDFGGPSIEVSALATAGEDTLVVGTFQGELDLGSGTTLRSDICGSGWELFVIKLNGRGETVWARAITGASWISGQDLALADDGSIRLAGTFEGTVDLDPGRGEVLRTAAGLKGAFVIALDSEGAFRWASTFGGDWLGSVLRLAAGPSGSVMVLGSFQGTLDLDPGQTEDLRRSRGSYDIFLVKLDAQGQARWARSFGGPGLESPRGMIARSDGSMVAAGDFEDSIDLDPGEGSAEHQVDAGSASFLVSLDGEGDFQWGSTQPAIGGLAALPDGSVLVGGSQGRAALTLRRISPLGEGDGSVELPLQSGDDPSASAAQVTSIRAVAARSPGQATIGGLLVTSLGGAVGSRHLSCRPQGGIDAFLLNVEF